MPAVCLLSADCLFFQISHYWASNTETAQSKDVWNENLEYLMSSAVCLLLT